MDKDWAEKIINIFAMVFTGLLLLVIIVTYYVTDRFNEKEIKTTEQILPTIIINTKNVNGIITSDTTYIYK